jgi:L-aspartate oxidase
MLKAQGIDFTVDPIPVAPAAHYFCGGVLSTIEGITDIRNLFVAEGKLPAVDCMELTVLASNSLLEALVMAYKAGNHPSNWKKLNFPRIPEWKVIEEFNENEWVVISHNREIMGTIMQGYVGIRRSRRLLNYALPDWKTSITKLTTFTSIMQSARK